VLLRHPILLGLNIFFGYEPEGAGKKLEKELNNKTLLFIEFIKQIETRPADI